MAKAQLVTVDEVGLDVPDTRRALAQMLQERGADLTFITSLAAKESYARYAAFMLWDLVVHGKAHFSDGREFEIEGYNDWLTTVKFLFQHLDGPAREGAQFNGINVFKIYAGFDPDKV